jgi:tetratricopeptide (TPR) repeat protein
MFKILNTPFLLIILLLTVFGFAFSQGNIGSKENIAAISVLLDKERFDEVITESTKIIQNFPNAGDIYTLRGIAYLKKNDNEKALSDFTKALEVSLSEKLVTATRKMKVLTSYSLKKYDITIKETTILIEKNSKDSKDFVYRGWSYFFTDKFKEAVADFDLSLKIEPEQLGIRRFRASSQNKLGNYEKAVEDINEELKINSKPHNESYQIRAEAYRKLGKLDLAESDEKKYSELTDVKSDNKSIENAGGKLADLIVKADKLFKSGNWSSAILTYNEIIGLARPDDESLYAIYFVRGRCFYQTEEYQAALDDYNEVVKRNPSLAIVYTFRGEIFIKQNKLDGALVEFNKAIELNRKEVLTYRRRAEVFYLKKEYAKAVKDCDEVIKLDSSYKSAWYYRAESNFELEDYKTALADISEYIKLDEQEILAFRLRAKIYQKLGDQKLADEDNKKALTLEQIKKVISN